MPRRPRYAWWLLVLIASSGTTPPSAGADDAAGPTVREFLGLNTHTVRFKPERYDGLVYRLRDYHPVGWDLDKNTSELPAFPRAKNGVDWEKLYGRWNHAGYDPHIALLLSNLKPDQWRDLPRDAERYGEAIAKQLGPSGRGLVSSVGIGNEPGYYSDEEYRQLFQSLARGLRRGDPELLITTCAAQAGPSDKYSKSIELLRGDADLFDVITIHAYAQAEGWPTWRRSFPEDPSIEYLTRVRRLLRWRDDNLPGKPVWICEFGWDCSTKQPDPDSTFAKWQDVSDLQQAQYLVRSSLVFLREGVDRAYIYFFDDSDKPSVHAAAGLTRNGEPKKSWYAVRHLQQTLGDYRLSEVLSEQPGGLYAYALQRADDPQRQVVVAWLATGEGGTQRVEIPVGQRRFARAERMPTADGPAEEVAFRQRRATITATLGESPVYFLP